MNGLKESQRSEVIILVFIADQNAEYRKKVKTSVSEQFSSLVESGNIQVIVAPPAFYPPNLHTLPRLYGDTPARVAWRSKQSLDYSFMYYYAGGLGEYYLQLEDDVITEDNYLTSIKEYINSRTQPWSTLEFGSRGFIGMLYKAEHLTSLARYCRLYFWTMPIDWLFRFYNDIFLHGNSVNNVRKPPLFKHIGAFSSLDGQIRKLEDIASNAGKSEVIPRAFKDADNPKVIVRTSIVDFVPPHSIETAYLKGTGYFWGKTIKIGDSVTLILEQPKKLKKVAISSGSPLYPSDALENGEVLLSPDTNGKCGDYTSIHSFKSKAEVVVDNIGVSFLVKCVQFKLNSVRMDDHGRPRWLVIKEIAIWTAKVK